MAVVLLLLLASRIILAPQPFAGFSPRPRRCGWCPEPLCGVDPSLGDLVGLHLASAGRVRSGSPLSARPRSLRLRQETPGGCAGWRGGWPWPILVVCSIGLITRLAPDLWPIAPNLAENRLSYPITYWNALGLLASMGTILCLHFTSSRSEPRALRLAGAGAIPILVTTLYFTFSRGAILAGAIGLVDLHRPRPAPGTPQRPAGDGADGRGRSGLLLPGRQARRSPPTSSAATSQGHHLALVIGLCVAGALLLRWLLLALDVRMDRLRLPTARGSRRSAHWRQRLS